MHKDQLRVDVALVTTLIRDQFPLWSDKTVTALETSGTVNAIFRLGDDLTARFPLQAGDPDNAREALFKEGAAMSEVARLVSCATPEHMGMGEPGAGYPMPWSVQTWVEGAIATPTSCASSEAAVSDICQLITELRSADTHGRSFSGGGRGGDLRDHDPWVHTCLEESHGLLDVARLRDLWEQFRQLPSHGVQVMSHGDLIPQNILTDQGRVVGVIDTGGFGPADPSLDLVVAWHLFDSERRLQLRATLDCSELEWRRGAAWGFEQAIGLAWYYKDSNPTMSQLGRSTLDRILTDPQLMR